MRRDGRQILIQETVTSEVRQNVGLSIFAHFQSIIAKLIEYFELMGKY